ncbi:MAG: hypothetical protein K2H18_02380 [Muribaculaceae bacterium]|nr:hypothetical protein [Muribaculaceae bacterium]
MENQEVISDNSGITFFPEKPQRYRIMWWQIKKDGFEKWFNHLCEKLWFTDELCNAFTILCVNNDINVFGL